MVPAMDMSVLNGCCTAVTNLHKSIFGINLMSYSISGHHPRLNFGGNFKTLLLALVVLGLVLIR